MTTNRDRSHINRNVEVWIAAPSSLRTNATAFDLLVNAALEWLRPFGCDGVIEAGLCKYRPTPQGRAMLADAWLTGATNLVMMSGVTPAFASLLSETDQGADAFVQFSLTLPIADGAEGNAFLLRLATATQVWAVAVDAAVAFIFDDPFVKHNPFFLDEEALVIHDFQITSREPRLDQWWAARRYTRGPAWANYLGPDLCNRLGGREYVVRDAPVWKAEAVGAGAWLTLTPTIPCPLGAFAPLVAFLAPLYDWGAYRSEYDAWRANPPALSTQLALTPTDEPRNLMVARGAQTGTAMQLALIPTDEPRILHPRPPVHILPDADQVGGWEGGTNGRRHLGTLVNLHTAEPMTADDRGRLDTVIRACYPVRDGAPAHNEMFDTRATTPEISSYVARFVYGREASVGDPYLDRLREELRVLVSPHMTEIVLGSETVG